MIKLDRNGGKESFAEESPPDSAMINLRYNTMIKNVMDIYMC